jgi:hypothetical protein
MDGEYSLLMSSLIEGHMGCFQFLTTTKKVLEILKQVFSSFR